jgi:hypothetical protein
MRAAWRAMSRLGWTGAGSSVEIERIHHVRRHQRRLRRGRERTEQGRRRPGIADPSPQPRQPLPCSFGSALGQPVGHRDGVHRAGAGAADRIEGEARLLQEPVEDAPGEGAERAAALQREAQRFGRLFGAAALQGK